MTESLPMIELDALSKRFALYRSPRHRLYDALCPWSGGQVRQFEALSPVTLALHRGERLGVVGRNGSGKSTLLNLLCGVMQPSSGRVTVRGRVAALLELGAGFDPEFTGRQNVLLQARFNGLTGRLARQRMAEIEAFADIGPFIDQPVKTYSSGMFVRLAFAFAIAVDPEILVIDEALAVGDEAFQRKCYARITEMIGRGVTLVFVSHASQTVLDLCDRVLLLDAGVPLMLGAPSRVLGWYQQLLYADPSRRDSIRHQMLVQAGAAPVATVGAEQLQDADDGALVSGFDPSLRSMTRVCYPAAGADLQDIGWRDADDQPVNRMVFGASCRYGYTVILEQAVARVQLGMMIRTVTGQEVSGEARWLTPETGDCFAPGTRLRIWFDVDLTIAPGMYFTNAGVLTERDGQVFYMARVIDATMFQVLPVAGYTGTGPVKLVRQMQVFVAGGPS